MPGAIISLAQVDFKAAERAYSRIDSADVRDRTAISLLRQAPDVATMDRLLADIRSEDSLSTALRMIFPRLEAMSPELAERYRPTYQSAFGTDANVTIRSRTTTASQ